MKIFKYQVEEELRNLEEINTSDFYDYINRITTKKNKIFRTNEKNRYKYYCTNCRSWHEDSKIKIYHYKTCPKCHRKFEVLSKRNTIKEIRDFITRVEKNDRNELIIRVFYFSKKFNKDLLDFDISCFEVERINADRQIYMNANTHNSMSIIYFYEDGKPFHRDRAKYYNYIYADYVYTTGLKKLIKNTQFRYSCLDTVSKQHIDIISYLAFYLKEPKIELFVKNCNFNIVKECSYKESLRVGLDDKRNIKYLKYDVTYDEFKTAVHFDLTEYKDIRAFCKCKMANHDAFIHQHNLDSKIHRIANYLYKQKEDMSYYIDYLNATESFGVDIHDNNILFPVNLVKAHDDAIVKYDLQKNELIDKNILSYSKELQEYVYSNRNFVIYPVSSFKELLLESQELHHCVKMYGEPMSKKQCAIFFIRKKEDINNPFVTLEKRDTKIIQCRAKFNEKPNDKVITFVNEWCKKFKLKSCFS